jgi:hypothetical protein
MSFMFEVYYRPPTNPTKEQALTTRVASLGGRLDYREDAGESGLSGVCLTYEFDDFEMARTAAERLRQLGEHVEGPVDYGDN